MDDPFLGPPPDGGLAMAMAEQRVLGRLLGTEPEPLRVARFVLQRELGRGGMGSVWLALDEQLQREVALKLLRSDLDPERGDHRLLEEAQSLAQLSHPNVITVYDLGHHEGRVWIAMEYVVGQTFRAWLSSEPRPKAHAILERWLAAGRGLAAMHQIGLVHRDIKPDNVLIGEDGRVRLIDFGLVRSLDPSEADAPSTDPPVPPVSGSGPQATATGAFVGTFAYAPPEQRAGERVDARADQYAYCVSLWEALTGERPTTFPPASGGERPRMSPRIRRALLRGLDPDPRRRHPSMAQLLRKLESRRWLWLSAAGASAALALGLAAGSTLSSSDQALAPCTQTDLPLLRSLGPARREALLEPLAPAPAQALASLLDDWSQRWREAALRSCEEVHVEQTRSAESLDRRRACLDASIVELEVVLATLERGLPPSGLRFAQLRDPRSCLSSSVLDRRAPVPSGPKAARAAELRAELVRQRLGDEAPGFDERIRATERILAETEQLGVPTLHAYALETLVDLDTTAGHTDSALDHAGALIDLATQLDDTALLAGAWQRRAVIELELQLDLEAASWSAQRCMELADTLEDQPRVRARGLVARAMVAFARGELDDATRDLREASEELARAGLASYPLRARVLDNLARVLAARGEHTAAGDARRQALQLTQRAPLEAGVKPRGEAHYKAAELAYGKGELDAALAAAKLALDAYREELGPDSRDLADSYVLLAAIELGHGRFASARQHAEAADELLRRNYGALDPDRFQAQTMLATAAFYARDFERASVAYALALELGVRVGKPERELGLARANLGETLLHKGRPLEARAQLERAIALLERLETPAQTLTIPRKALGASYLELGQLEAAQRELSRAHAELEAQANNPVELADATWLLAQTLLERGDKQRARALAESAREQFTALEQSTRVRAVEDWLGLQFP